MRGMLLGGGGTYIYTNTTDESDVQYCIDRAFIACVVLRCSLCAGVEAKENVSLAIRTQASITTAFSSPVRTLIVHL